MLAGQGYFVDAVVVVVVAVVVVVDILCGLLPLVAMDDSSV